MKKSEKLSLLNNIKSSEEKNDSCYSLNFPVHHKNKRNNATLPLPSQHLSETSRTTDRSSLDETVCSDEDFNSYVSDDDDDLANGDIAVDDVDIDQEFDSSSMEDAGDNGQEMSTNKNHFDGMRIHDHVDPSNIHQYFQININQKKKYIHKQTAAHVLTSNKHYLSSDRLARVQQMNKQTKL